METSATVVPLDGRVYGQHRTLGLSDAERKVALLLPKCNAEIAEELGISEATVKVHLKAAYRKMEVNNRAALALKMKGERSEMLPVSLESFILMLERLHVFIQHTDKSFKKADLTALAKLSKLIRMVEREADMNMRPKLMEAFEDTLL